MCAMKIFTILAIIVTVLNASAQKTEDVSLGLLIREDKDDDVTAGREKRGFLLTPVSSLPPEVLEPLLPIIRTITEDSAPQRLRILDAKGQRTSSISPQSLLSATAPLALEREESRNLRKEKIVAEKQISKTPQIFVASPIVKSTLPPPVPVVPNLNIVQKVPSFIPTVPVFAHPSPSHALQTVVAPYTLTTHSSVRHFASPHVIPIFL